MYGESGNKLVTDAKRIAALAHLPPYASSSVGSVTKEVRDLDREVSSLLAPYSSTSSASSGTPIKSSFNPASDPSTACALLVNHLSMRRNKRCLLAYHRTRTDKLDQMLWAGQTASELQTSPSSASATTATATASVLSAEEEQYAHAYADLLSAYKGLWTDVDLTGSLDPPTDVFVDVRVLKDAGEIQTEYGSITLTRNSQFFVRLADVEGLIRQGYLMRLG